MWYSHGLHLWDEFVAILSNILSHLRCPMLYDLVIVMHIHRSCLYPDHPDSDFTTIDLGPVHALQNQKTLRTLKILRSVVTISTSTDSTSEATETQSVANVTQSVAEVARELVKDRLHLILEPLDKRGILQIRLQ